MRKSGTKALNQMVETHLLWTST